jgi:hypothetical protein
MTVWNVYRPLLQVGNHNQNLNHQQNTKKESEICQAGANAPQRRDDRGEGVEAGRRVVVEDEDFLT